MSELSSTDKFIRKLRKKLREIERLEISDRSSLNREEIAKVFQRNEVLMPLLQFSFSVTDKAKEGYQRRAFAIIGR